MNEEVIELLREIRDLQKLHVENYKDALKNQQVSIEFQQNTSRLYRRALGVLAVVVLLGIAFMIVPSFLSK